MEIASEFIFVAATLMRIKARTLLPSLVGEEETDEPDLKEDLIQRLIAYKQFKEACEGLRILEERRLQMSARMSLSQLYHENERAIKAGYAKFETFPIWNVPLKALKKRRSWNRSTFTN